MKETPVECVIRIFGGVRPLARVVGVTPGAVCKWRKTGLVPARFHLALIEFARKKRKRLNATILVHGA